MHLKCRRQVRFTLFQVFELIVATLRVDDPVIQSYIYESSNLANDLVSQLADYIRGLPLEVELRGNCVGLSTHL